MKDSIQRAQWIATGGARQVAQAISAIDSRIVYAMDVDTAGFLVGCLDAPERMAAGSMCAGVGRYGVPRQSITLRGVEDPDGEFRAARERWVNNPGSVQMAAEVQAIVDRIKRRSAAKQPAPAPAQPQAVRTVDQVRSELKAARVGFDPSFPFSDDHNYFCEQQRKSDRIASLTYELQRMEAAQ